LNALPSRRRARARRGHGGRPCPPRELAPRVTPGNGGPASTRPAPRRADPEFQFSSSPGAPPAPAPRRSSARRGRRRGEELEIWNPGNLGSPRRPAGSQVGEESLSLLHAPVHTRTWVPPRGPSGKALWRALGRAALNSLPARPSRPPGSRDLSPRSPPHPPRLAPPVGYTAATWGRRLTDAPAERGPRARGPGCAAARSSSGASYTSPQPGVSAGPGVRQRSLRVANTAPQIALLLSDRPADRPGPRVVPRRPRSAARHHVRVRDPHAAPAARRRGVLVLPARERSGKDCAPTASAGSTGPAPG
jgi:hypothetical protein